MVTSPTGMLMDVAEVILELQELGVSFGIAWAVGLRDSQLTLTRGVHFGHGGVVGCDYWIGTCLVPWVATVNI
jgi:hypothetical protein